MPDSHVNECLSAVDAFFLYLERPGTPLNVASISVFEGVITLSDCTSRIESKLPLLPRFTQRVVFPPLGVGLPTWQYDHDFDIRNHIRERMLTRGTEFEFKEAVADILSENLSRDQPLWDITLVHGLKRDRTGVIIRVHHCLVDGIAGVGIMKSLLDPSPVTSKPKTARRHVKRIHGADPTTVLIDGFVSSFFAAGQALLSTQSELLRMAQQISGVGAKPSQNSPQESDSAPSGGLAQLGKLANVLSELAQPVDRMPFNTLCRGPQKFEWLEIPLQELMAVKHACAGTVNDVVLTVLASALRRYAEEHHCSMKGRKVRIVVPVNLRETSEASDTGNHITFLPVDIPLAARTPAKLLATVQQRVKSPRNAYSSELVKLVTTMLGAVPVPLQAVIGSILSHLPISLCNSICTNVHGPNVPLYLGGHKMLASYPYVPIGGEMGMNCAVLSYNGTLFVGFTGDAGAVPDLERLPLLFRECFTELRAAAGVRTAKRRAPVRKAKPVPPPPAESPVPAESRVEPEVALAVA
jgi:diacylglycerol O-acyltransferase